MAVKKIKKKKGGSLSMLQPAQLELPTGEQQGGNAVKPLKPLIKKNLDAGSDVYLTILDWTTFGRRGGLTVSALDCVLVQDTLLSVPHFTQVYKWITPNLIPRVSLQWTSIPSRGE